MSFRCRIPRERLAGARRAAPSFRERGGVVEEPADGRRERLDVAGGDDATRAEAPDRLPEAADVVRDGGDAGTQGAEERAALVDLRPVREEGERGLSVGPVDLGLREVAEPPVDAVGDAEVFQVYRVIV